MCALLTAVKNYNKSFEKLKDFFFKTEIKTKTKINVQDQDQDFVIQDQDQDFHFCPRGAETKTLVSKTTSLLFTMYYFVRTN